MARECIIASVVEISLISPKTLDCQCARDRRRSFLLAYTNIKGRTKYI